MPARDLPPLWAATAAVLVRATRPMHFSMVAKRLREADLASFDPADGPPPLQVRTVLLSDGPLGPLFEGDERGYFQLVGGTNPEDMPPVRQALDVLGGRSEPPLADDEVPLPSGATLVSDQGPPATPPTHAPDDIRSRLADVEQRLQELLGIVGQLRRDIDAS